MRRKIALACLLVVLCTVKSNDSFSKVLVSNSSNANFITNSNFNIAEFAVIDRNIRTFIANSHIKGASLAVVKDGQLIYAKGYGYADVKQKLEVEPYHLFRIASVSKLITATGIMDLVQKGMLSLDRTVFGPNGILKDSVYSTYRDARYEKITVKMLLNHSAGWSGRRADPMFSKELISQIIRKPLPLSFNDIVSYVFRTNLDFEPGTRSSYSNFGYVVLGQIIEAVSGEKYETYIQKNILRPLGITTAHIANNFPEEKYPNEVSYYDLRGVGMVKASDGSGRLVPRNAGGNDIKMLGPAGGWVASSVDIAKLLIGVAGYERYNIIPQELIEQMTTREQFLQPLGWIGSDNEGRCWRSGSLSGTSAMVVKEKNGLAWVFLTNTSTKAGNRLPHIIDGVVHRSLNSVQEWPTPSLWSFTTHLDSLKNL